MQKNGIFSFCSGSFSKYNVKVRRDCTITFDTHIIYKKSIKYKKMRKHEKIRGIKRIKENINKLHICIKFTNIKLYNLTVIMQYIFLNFENYSVV